MALRTAGSRREMGHRLAFERVGAVVLLAAALGACSPIDTWRDAYGISRNDPDPVNAPFTQNLADAEAASYPNLASVPPPPTRATTVAERQKLAQSLVADRAAAEMAVQTTGTPTPLSGANHKTPATFAAAVPPGAASPPPVAGATSAGAPAGATAPPAKAASAAPERGSPQTGRRTASQPSQPTPRDSTLQVPDVRALPEPDAARPAPPPPALAAAPRPAPAPAPLSLATVAPQAAPPAPDMTPPPGPPPSGKPAAERRPPAVTTVATLAGGGRDEAEISRVAALYKAEPGSVRVVAYAAAPAGGGDPLAGYQAALDRAQAVAKALAAAGIPAAKIQTEASPSTGASGRVEIQLGPDAAVAGARR